MENDETSEESNIARSVINCIYERNKQTFFKDNLAEYEPKEMESLASDASQKFFIMRHGERVDFTFGPWIERCFDDSGNYNRKDLNMPLTLPKRKLGAAGYKTDTSLTQMGIYQSVLVGEGLKTANVNVEHVYCSPALRCVQTCDGVLRGLGKKDEIKIRIEPALIDWLGWSDQKLSDWMTAEELIVAGYNIDTDYRPYMLREDLIGTTDTYERYFARQSKIVRHALASHSTGNILFVAHGFTIKCCTYELLGNSKPSFDEIMHGMEFIEYATLQALSKNEDKWEIIRSSPFSVTHCQNLKFHANKMFS